MTDVDPYIGLDSRSEPTIKFKNATLRWDNDGVCHTDAVPDFDGCCLQFGDQVQRRWLCVHEPGKTECPSPEVTARIVAREISAGRVLDDGVIAGLSYPMPSGVPNA